MRASASVSAKASTSVRCVTGVMTQLNHSRIQMQDIVDKSTNLFLDHLLDTLVDSPFCVRFTCRLQANDYALALLESFLRKTGNGWDLHNVSW